MYSKKIKALRTERNIKALDIADYLGIKIRLYYKYEGETEIFSIKYLTKVCEYFNISLDYIFDFVSTPNYPNNNYVINQKLSGERLKKLRLSLYLNQENLANMLGISRSNISNYETGLTTIPTDYLYALCKKFNISADYLLGKTDNPQRISVSKEKYNWKIENTTYMYSNRLKYLREKNNIKREELAKLLGIHVKRYNQYENEYDTLPLKHINTLCNYYDVSLDYIFSLSGEEKYNSYKKEIDLKIHGNNIKLLRKNKNLTLDKFAKELNSKIGTISNYEKGRILISTKLLYKICKKYNVSADWLLGKVDKN